MNRHVLFLAHVLGPVFAVCIMWLIASSGLIEPAIAESDSMGTECVQRLTASGEEDMEFFVTYEGRRDATVVTYVPYFRDGKVDGSYTIEYQCSKRDGTYYYSWKTQWPDYVTTWSLWYPFGGRVPNDGMKELPED